MNSNYWDNFYDTNNGITEKPSSFCDFTLNYLKDYPEHKTLIDLGCGNGRDLMHFKQNNYICSGIDSSKIICDKLKNLTDVNIICKSFVSCRFDKYDIYYSRFSIHALNYESVLDFIYNISIKMDEKSLLFIETRSIKGSKYENCDYYVDDFESGIGEKHKRTLFNKKYLINLFNRCNLFTEYDNETNNLSPYNGDNPYLIRLVFRKLDVYLYLSNMINYSLLSTQYCLKKNFDNTIKIFEENNINYCVFFGNLIGLLRHNNLFIPWDDDIDILVDKKDIEIIKKILLENDYDIVIDLEHYMLKFSINNISIDLFYDHEVNYLVDITDFEYISGYRVPKNFTDAFKVFYGPLSSDNILKSCVIYNHKINCRWSSKHMVKVVKDKDSVEIIVNDIYNDLPSNLDKTVDYIKNIKYDTYLEDICINIIIPLEKHEPNYILKNIITILNYHKIDIYMSVCGYIYDILEKYFDILNEKGLYFYKNDNAGNDKDKNICNHFFSLNSIHTKEYKRIILYNQIPTFINKLDNHLFVNNTVKIDFNKNDWFNESVSKDIEKLNNYNITLNLIGNMNGIILNYDEYIKLLNIMENIIKNINCNYYPILETIVPNIANNNNIKYSNVDYTIFRDWDCFNILNSNHLDKNMFFSYSHKF